MVLVEELTTKISLYYYGQSSKGIFDLYESWLDAVEERASQQVVIA